MTDIDISELEIGQIIGEREYVITRESLVRYAGASLDFNPIHFSDAHAKAVGLESVIAHGMLTMGCVIAPVLNWIKDPAKITTYETRFTKPIAVPDGLSATILVKAVVGAIDSENKNVRIDLTVTNDGVKVLTKSRAIVQL